MQRARGGAPARGGGRDSYRGRDEYRGRRCAYLQASCTLHDCSCTPWVQASADCRLTLSMHCLQPQPQPQSIQEPSQAPLCHPTTSSQCKLRQVQPAFLSAARTRSKEPAAPHNPCAAVCSHALAYQRPCLPQLPAKPQSQHMTEQLLRAAVPGAAYLLSAACPAAALPELATQTTQWRIHKSTWLPSRVVATSAA